MRPTKKITFLTSLFLSCALGCFTLAQETQSTLDSLHLLIKQAQPKDKIDPLLKLSDYYGQIETENLDSMQYYGRQALELSKMQNEPMKEIDATIQLGLAELYANNLDSALTQMQKILSESEALNYHDGTRIAHRRIGGILIEQKQLVPGFYHFNKAYDLARKHNASKQVVVDLAIDLSTEYMILEYWEEGAKLLEDAIKIVDDPVISLESKGIFYGNLALINEVNENFPEAIKYYEKSIEFLRADQKPHYEITNLSNLAGVYGNLDDFERSLEIYLQALELIDQGPSHYGSISYGLGFTYMELGDYANAKHDLQESIDFHKEQKRTYRVATTMYTMSTLYEKENNPAKAKQYQEDAYQRYLVLIKENKENGIRKDEISDAYLYLSRMDSTWGNYSKSLAHYKDHIIYKDSIANETKIKVTERLEFARETAKRDQEITLLTAENELSALKNEKLRNFRIALIIGIALLLLFLILLYNRYKLKQKAFKIIQEKNEENKLLMREIHHRVKNNLQIILSLLGAQASTNQDDDKLVRALLESQNKVKAMALIHQNLYGDNNFTMVRTDSYLNELIENIEKSFAHSKEQVLFEADIISREIKMGLAIPLGLIINELVTNCYKYAFDESKADDNRIRISFKQMGQSNKYLLRIEDNGKGLPEDFDLDNPSSFGLQLVHGLVQQLQGSIEIVQNQGTVFDIQLEEPMAA